MRYSPGASRLVLGVAAIGLLLAARLPFMAPSVDDLDSTNFYEGVLDFSPPAHRPHPPGFPVFILAAKGFHALTGSPVLALTLLSTVASVLAVVFLVLISRRLFSADVAVVAGVVLAATPIVWFLGVRPMSDAAGLAAGLLAQALLLEGLDRRRRAADLFWMAGTVAAGLAIGVRLQLSLLVLPLFLFGWTFRLRVILLGPALLAGAVASWWVPMMAHSGGFDRYLIHFRRTMAEAASWEPLLSSPSVDRAVEGLWHVTVMPWATIWLAGPVLFAAAVGLLRALRDYRPALALLVLLYAPYWSFNYLIQNTPAVRYAIPAVPLVAILAALGVTWLRSSRGVVAPLAVAAYVVAASAVMLPTLRDYRGGPSPALQAMHAVPRRAVDRPVLTGSEVFTRYVSFAPPDLAVISPVDGEGWRRLNDYWRKGGRAPAYVLLTDNEAIQSLVSREAYTEAGRWQWSARVMPLMSGERPNLVRLARIDSPTWFARRLRTVPATRMAHLGLFVRGDGAGHDVLLQGRSADEVPQAFTLSVNGETHDRQEPGRSFTLQGRVRVAGRYSERYAELDVLSDRGVQIARVVAVRPSETHLQPTLGFRRVTTVEGFDADRLASEAAVLVHVPPQGAVLCLSGRLTPEAVHGVTLTVEWNGRRLHSEQLLGPSFDVDVPIEQGAEPWMRVTFRTLDAAGQPAEALDVTALTLEVESPVTPNGPSSARPAAPRHPAGSAN